MSITPLRFAAVVEESVKAKDPEINFVGFKQATALGYEVVVLTCKKYNQIFECRIEWFLVQQSLSPEVFVQSTCKQIISQFTFPLAVQLPLNPLIKD